MWNRMIGGVLAVLLAVGIGACRVEQPGGPAPGSVDVEVRDERPLPPPDVTVETPDVTIERRDVSIITPDPPPPAPNITVETPPAPPPPRVDIGVEVPQPEPDTGPDTEE